MAVGISSMRIEGLTITIIRTYDILVHDFTCDELKLLAKEFNLPCLRYLNGAGDCIFNYYQCQDILSVEIPLLRTKILSARANTALDVLENAIKDVDDTYAFLSLEGD